MSDQSKRPKLRCYLAIPQSRRLGVIRDAAEYALQRAGYDTITSDIDLLSSAVGSADFVSNTLAQSDLVVADLTEENPAVFYELGQAQSMGKGVICVTDSRGPDTLSPAFSNMHLIRYDRDNLDAFVKALQRAASNFRRSPGRFVAATPNLFSSPFYIDWDKLSDRDTDNLCQELLSQMGYRRIRWRKLPIDIDIVAQLPRKDPDGFDYDEL